MGKWKNKDESDDEVDRANLDEAFGKLNLEHSISDRVNYMFTPLSFTRRKLNQFG